MTKAKSMQKLYNGGMALHDIAKLYRVHIHTVIEIVYALNVDKRKSNDIQTKQHRNNRHTVR